MMPIEDQLRNIYITILWIDFVFQPYLRILVFIIYILHCRRKKVGFRHLFFGIKRIIELSFFQKTLISLSQGVI